eukprot:7109504-Pyramimonas_sp.AAC.1
MSSGRVTAHREDRLGEGGVLRQEAGAVHTHHTPVRRCEEALGPRPRQPHAPPRLRRYPRQVLLAVGTPPRRKLTARTNDGFRGSGTTPAAPARCEGKTQGLREKDARL